MMYQFVAQATHDWYMFLPKIVSWDMLRFSPREPRRTGAGNGALGDRYKKGRRKQTEPSELSYFGPLGALTTVDPHLVGQFFQSSLVTSYITMVRFSETFHGTT